jgi:hypothetical protein
VKDLPPLTHCDLEGRPYIRRPGTEEEIRGVLGSAQAAWDELANAGPPNRLSSETLVFLIRSVRDSDRNLAGKLIETLNHRILKAARRWCRGFDPMATEDILDNVLTEMVGRLLAPQPTRASEFLELAFERVVKTCTLKQVAKHAKRTEEPGGGTSEDGGSHEERPEEEIADPGPGPEEIISALADRQYRAELVRKAQAAITDPRHLEAVVLRHVHGWQLTASDPSKPSLERHFGKTSRQIQNWIDKGIQQMRESIGEDHD